MEKSTIIIGAGVAGRVTSPNFPYFRLDKGIIGELNEK